MYPWLHKVKPFLNPAASDTLRVTLAFVSFHHFLDFFKKISLSLFLFFPNATFLLIDFCFGF